MEKPKKWYLVVVLTIIFYLLAVIYFVVMVQPKKIDASDNEFQTTEALKHQEYWANKGVMRYTPTHKQLVWRFVLEWCESRGCGVDAINPKDLDGTASYYHFQWKPSTFKHYAIKYELLPNDLQDEDYFNWMSDWEVQAEILNRMMNDKDVVWKQEFPGCTKIHGYPPK